MAKNKTNPPGSREQRRRPGSDDEERQASGVERPPESAEDFGHVLRRLMSGRTARPERD